MSKRERQSSVRVIAGRLKGRRIPIASASIRPTSDRVRETVFNWLGPVLPGARCLDMFAGSGVLGIEAASRGAAYVQFIERDADAVRGLRQTLDQLECAGDVLKGDAAKLDYSKFGQFDIVFLDPPFNGPNLADLCTLLEQSGCLTPSALVYMEMSRQTPPPELPPGWEVLKDKKAGQVRYGLAERRMAND